MCRPTRQPFRGRLIRPGEMSEEYAQLLHRGSGGSMYTRKAHATREAPTRDQGWCSRTSSNGATVKVFRSTTPAAKARPNRRPVSVSLDGPAPAFQIDLTEPSRMGLIRL